MNRRIQGPAVPRVAGPHRAGAAMLGVGAPCVVQLRGHALTHPVGGPTIAGLIAVLLVVWRSWVVVPEPAAAR